MVIEYTKIELTKIKNGPPQKTNGIIEGLVEKIREHKYHRGREIEISYDKKVSPVGIRITRTSLKSKDGLLGGEISYNDRWCDREISVNLNFH